MHDARKNSHHQHTTCHRVLFRCIWRQVLGDLFRPGLVRGCTATGGFNLLQHARTKPPRHHRQRLSRLLRRTCSAHGGVAGGYRKSATSRDTHTHTHTHRERDTDRRATVKMTRPMPLADGACCLARPVFRRFRRVLQAVGMVPVLVCDQNENETRSLSFHHETILRPALDPLLLLQQRPALRPPPLCYLSLSPAAAANRACRRFVTLCDHM